MIDTHLSSGGGGLLLRAGGNWQRAGAVVHQLDDVGVAGKPLQHAQLVESVVHLHHATILRRSKRTACMYVCMHASMVDSTTVLQYLFLGLAEQGLHGEQLWLRSRRGGGSSIANQSYFPESAFCDIFDEGDFMLPHLQRKKKENTCA